MAFLSSIVILDGGVCALASGADTLFRICLASANKSLLNLMVDFVAVMRSAAVSCCGEMANVSPLAKTFFSGWVNSLLDKVVTHLSCLSVVSSYFLSNSKSHGVRPGVQGIF